MVMKMKKSLTSKTKFFILIFVYAFVIAVWYIFGYSYIQSQIDDYKHKKNEMKINYNQLPKIFTEITILEKKDDSLRQEIDKIKAKITKIQNLNRVKSAFMNFSKRYNLKCDEFSALTQIYYQKQEEHKEEKYLTLPVNIVLSGKYANFVKMLNNLDRFDYIMTVGYMTIKPDELTENKVNAIIVGNLLIENEIIN